MAELTALLEPFAHSIYSKASALQRLDLTKGERARFLESISDDIKKCTNFVVAGTSKAAYDKAASLGVNLCFMNWHDQPRFDKGRETFHLEHMVPVSRIRQLCLESRSAEEVLRVLTSKPRCVWILKAEDRKLTSLGYRVRRNNPDEAYRAAGIQLMPEDSQKRQGLKTI